MRWRRRTVRGVGVTRLVVLVNWLDAAGGIREGWRSTRKMARLKPAKCQSVGFLLKKTRRAIVVCPHLCHDGDGDGEIVIPRGWVTSIKRLK